MPSVIVELSSDQLEQAQTYAERHEISLEEVISRAMDHFLALAWADSSDVDLACRDHHIAQGENHLRHLDEE
jgi:hypothetical protein